MTILICVLSESIVEVCNHIEYDIHKTINKVKHNIEIILDPSWLHAPKLIVTLGYVFEHQLIWTLTIQGLTFYSLETFQLETNQFSKKIKFQWMILTIDAKICFNSKAY